MRYTTIIVGIALLLIAACSSSTQPPAQPPSVAAPPNPIGVASAGAVNNTVATSPSGTIPPPDTTQPQDTGDAANPPSTNAVAVGMQAPDTGELSVREFMICDTTQKIKFARDNGYTCTQQCPAGYDAVTASFGTVCTPHYGQSEISQWPTCSTSADCSSRTRCGLAPLATDGSAVSSSDLRCMPNSYVIYLATKGNLTLR